MDVCRYVTSFEAYLQMMATKSKKKRGKNDEKCSSMTENHKYLENETAIWKLNDDCLTPGLDLFCICFKSSHTSKSSDLILSTQKREENLLGCLMMWKWKHHIKSRNF
ncbi:CLUMA_CG007833, isoform A [Clunio marinus]|uniref:CLUMA_CG007833, isoform A n=1 Tax=Clunio marinus TaxID=568069 RepID=A0A1J1I5V0_9DIPT|nr:CLUMA_CG007833, isoform A [Clunio marinus]